MKKLALSCFTFLLVTFSVTAQADTAMTARLDSFIHLNKALNFEKLMDYIYPGIFSIAPKEQLVEVFRSTFAGNDEIAMEMDSLQTGKISPVLTVGKGSYHLVAYSMLMRMQIKNQKAGSDTSMLGLLKSQYGAERVRYDAPSGKYIIAIYTSMVAVKDELSPQWTFINFQPDHPLAAQLLDEQVITQLKTFLEEQSN